MEYVSVLAGQRTQSDRPSCTHPLLAALAREVNDRITDDAALARLALLAPRLIDTGTDDPRLEPMLTLVCLKAAAAAGAEGPDFDHRVWRARTALRRVNEPGAHRRRRNPSRVHDELTLHGAIRTGWRQLRSHAGAERDRWLVGLLQDAVEHTHRLLRPMAEPTPAPPTKQSVDRPAARVGEPVESVGAR